MFFAGLWKPAGEGTETCCALLTEPVSPAFAFIHDDRQPVVLDPECRWQWLDPELSERDTIRKVARRPGPYPVRGDRILHDAEACPFGPNIK